MIEVNDGSRENKGISEGRIASNTVTPFEIGIDQAVGQNDGDVFHDDVADFVIFLE